MKNMLSLITLYFYFISYLKIMDFKKIIDKVSNVWKNIASKANYLSVIDWVADAKSIGIIWHDKIDWDSLGSVLAMQRWIKNKFPNKKVKAYTNRKYPSVFEFLKPEIKYGENLKIDEDTDLLIILDSANLERLGDLYENNKEKIDKTYKINIDHHISNDNFGDINIVDWQSPATAQIVYEILKVLDIHPMAQMNTLKSGIDDKVALYLLMGILTDTQNFMIPLATDKTLEVAANLIKLWADKQLLINNIFLNKKPQELKLQWLVLDRIKEFEKNGVRCYWSYYTQQDLEKLGLDPEDSWVGRSLVSILNQVSDTDFVCLWKLLDDETTISFRSKSYDVNALASKLWGGGHKNASGAKLDKKISPEEIEKMLQELL